MRLIDANAYKASLKKWKEDAWKHNERHDAMLIADCLCELEMMPTVDAVEVKHGRWSPVTYGLGVTVTRWMCSNCKKYENSYGRTNYCPNCGAKMDGDWNG